MSFEGPLLDGALSWSELIRNLGLIIAAAIGFAFAYRRIRQTDLQIEQAQDQFEEAQANNRLKQDRDTYREGAMLLADESSAISLAGVTLLQNLERDGEFAEQAKDLLDGYTVKKWVFMGSDQRDRVLVDRACRQWQSVDFTDTYFEDMDLDCTDNVRGKGPFLTGCTLNDIGLVAPEEENSLIHLSECDILRSIEVSDEITLDFCQIEMGNFYPSAKCKIQQCVLVDGSEEAGTIKNALWLIDGGIALEGCAVFSGSACETAFKMRGVEIEALYHSDDAAQFFPSPHGPGVPPHIRPSLPIQSQSFWMIPPEGEKS